MKLLERDAHLGALHAALEKADAGLGQMVLISGEAGIGKTSLVDTFLAGQQSTRQVLWGACDSLFTPRPLGPFHDIALQTQGNLLDTLSTQTNRQAIFSACISEIQKSPVILVIEDIHWADDATLDLLKYLGRRIQRTSALVLLTYRDDEIGLQHPLRLLLGDLATSSYTHSIHLPGLSENAVRKLASHKTLDPLLLYRQTNGNPFFITEVLANPGGIPGTVRDAVLARAARLSLSGRAALDAAAVIGLRIEPWLLAQVAGAEAAAVEECMSAGMIQAQGDALTFRHDLARQTILDAISPQKRQTLQGLVLSALQESPLTRADLARLAHHAEAASDQEAVLRYAPAAAVQAAAVNAHRAAAAQYELALRFAQSLPPDELANLLEAYALECNIIDQREKGIAARTRAVEIWREAGNALKQGVNLALLVVMYFGVGQTAEAEKASREAIEILEKVPPSRELGLAYRIQATLRMLVRDQADAIAWGEKAIVLAERFGDTETLCGAYNAIGSAWITTDYEQGRKYLELSLSTAREAALELQVSNAYNNLSSASGEVYRFDQADAYLQKGIANAIEYDFDVSRMYMLAWQALTHLHLGRWDAAAESAGVVLQQPGVSAISRIMALLAVGRLRARRGDPGVWDALDEALMLAEQTQTVQRIAPVRAARAEAAWLVGDLERGSGEARADYETAFQKKHPWFVGELAFWGWRCNQKPELPAWAARPYQLQISGDWQAAAAEWEQLHCPYERAQALADGDEAAQLAALRLFEQLGARPALEKLKQAMHAKGVRGIPRGPRPATQGRPYTLTSREMEVFELLSRGLSNPEIAAELSISPRTAEHHISAILSKLGVGSRGEAISVANRQKLFPAG